MTDVLINYLLITYLLSIVGTLLYLFLRNKVSLDTRRWLLLGTIGFSLAIPWVMDSLKAHTDAHIYEVCLHEHTIPEDVWLAYCPDQGEEMEMCYELAASTEGFCNCQEVVLDNLILFKSQPTYDFLLASRPLILNAVPILACIILLLLFVRIAYLFYIIRISKKEELKLGNQKYIILYPPRPISVGSFQLFHSYIIWQDDLSILKEKERNAILWHEVAHIVQKDTWSKIGLSALQVIWIFNPVFYFLRKELDRLSEFIADRFAIINNGDTPQDYAQLLLKMKKLQLASTLQSTATEGGAMVSYFGESELKARVKQILSKKTQTRRFNYQHLSTPFIGLLLFSISITNYYSMPVITRQLDHLKVYQSIATLEHESGQQVFCRNCIKKQNTLDQ